MKAWIRDRPNRVPWPPLLLVLVVAGAIFAGYVIPLSTPWSGSWVLRAFGFAGVVAAIGLDVAAMREMRGRRANILPHRAATALVTSGPFAFSRNPIYLGNIGLLIGGALFFGNPWFLAASIVDGALTYVLAIRREEAHLALKFGQQWTLYRSDTPRWLRLWRL